MKSSLLTPRMAGILERMHRAQRPALHSLTVAQARQFYEQGAEILDLPRVPLARTEALEIPTSDGQRIRARLYADRLGDPLPLMLYFHGGGFVIGSLETHDSLCRQLALRSGVAVLAVDYRLAPEHRFPVAASDACDALQWALQHDQGLNVDADRVVVAGDSAGATLAAVAALHARDSEWALCGQVLITPHTVADAQTASRRQFGQGYLLDEQTLAWLFDQYADPVSRSDWRFAPALAPSFDGLAPALVLLAECDPLVDEGLLYADALRAAGNEVDLELVRGVTHEFIKMGRVLPEALAAHSLIADAVRRFCALA